MKHKHGSYAVLNIASEKQAEKKRDNLVLSTELTM